MGEKETLVVCCTAYSLHDEYINPKYNHINGNKMKNCCSVQCHFVTILQPETLHKTNNECDTNTFVSERREKRGGEVRRRTAAPDNAGVRTAVVVFISIQCENPLKMNDFRFQSYYWNHSVFFCFVPIRVLFRPYLTLKQRIHTFSLIECVGMPDQCVFVQTLLHTSTDTILMIRAFSFWHLSWSRQRTYATKE